VLAGYLIRVRRNGKAAEARCPLCPGRTARIFVGPVERVGVPGGPLTTVPRGPGRGDGTVGDGPVWSGLGGTTTPGRSSSPGSRGPALPQKKVAGTARRPGRGSNCAENRWRGPETSPTVAGWGGHHSRENGPGLVGGDIPRLPPLLFSPLSPPPPPVGYSLNDHSVFGRPCPRFVIDFFYDFPDRPRSSTAGAELPDVLAGQVRIPPKQTRAVKSTTWPARLAVCDTARERTCASAREKRKTGGAPPTPGAAGARDRFLVRAAPSATWAVDVSAGGSTKKEVLRRGPVVS